MSTRSQYSFCYYCGATADIPLRVSDSFTATDVKCPHAEVMCDRCHRVMFGDLKQVWVFNSERQQWVTLYLRSLSTLWQGDRLVSPVLGEPEEKIMVSASGRTGKPQTLPVAHELPNRVTVRKWLVNPPEPPFTIAIAESGKKHILYLAQEACDRSFFPVQFEIDTLYLEHVYFVQLLTAFELLMALEFSKTEINSGIYRVDRVRAARSAHISLDAVLAPERCRGEPSRLLQLVSFVAQRSEPIKESIDKVKKDEIENKTQSKEEVQLALF